VAVIAPTAQEGGVDQAGGDAEEAINGFLRKLRTEPIGRMGWLGGKGDGAVRKGWVQACGVASQDRGQGEGADSCGQMNIRGAPCRAAVAWAQSGTGAGAGGFTGIMGRSGVALSPPPVTNSRAASRLSTTNRRAFIFRQAVGRSSCRIRPIWAKSMHIPIFYESAYIVHTPVFLVRLRHGCKTNRATASRPPVT